MKCNPKCRRIAGLPVSPTSIQRLKAPPMPGPVRSHGSVTVVDLRHQLLYWLPAKVKCNVRTDIQINSQNKNVSARTNQGLDVSQTLIGVGRTHMAEKIVSYYYVLRPKTTNQFRISDIAHSPSNAIAEP